MNGDAGWWKHGVIYQVYPRSFFDSNGDGVGDLPGICAKLDYLAELGVSGVWLSPINASPMLDFGYDVADYRGIDPLFGSLSDFDHLLREAHDRGIRIIMDLVLNHTSALHPWFVESRSSRESPKRNWYLWHEGRRPPNNWLSSFGGRAWEWDERTRQCYLHSFLRGQPDLNWRNSQVRSALFDEIRFWLDRGVDGFRLDVVNWLVKDARLRSNPFGVGPYPRPYDLQRHLYDRNRPETHEITAELRRLLDAYGSRMAVGEVYAEPPGDPLLSASFLGSGEDELHLAFDFSLSYARWNATDFAVRIARWMEVIPRGGWPCHVLSNHDQPRAISRYGARLSRGEADKRGRVAAFLLLTLRGTPFLYYGEEIGMRNGRIKRRELLDPVGKRYWPLNVGRDGERTPMRWSPEPNAGFTTGTAWLPAGDLSDGINVEEERSDPSSLLILFQRLIALRKEEPALAAGDWNLLRAGQGGVLVYSRSFEGKHLLITLNFERRASPAPLLEVEPGSGGSEGEVLFSTHRPKGERCRLPETRLAPYEATIWRAASQDRFEREAHVPWTDRPASKP